MVAERLRYKLIDQAMLDKVAQNANISVKSIAEVEKTAGDTVLSFFSELAASLPFVKHAAGISSDFDETKYRLFLKRTILQIAAQGNAVIIGRGSALVLKDHPDALRFYLVAKDEERVKSLITRYGYDEKKSRYRGIPGRKKAAELSQSIRSRQPGRPSSLSSDNQHQCDQGCRGSGYYL
jgi:cytidylate kinase